MKKAVWPHAEKTILEKHRTQKDRLQSACVRPKPFFYRIDTFLANIK